MQTNDKNYALGIAVETTIGALVLATVVTLCTRFVSDAGVQFVLAILNFPAHLFQLVALFNSRGPLSEKAFFELVFFQWFAIGGCISLPIAAFRQVAKAVDSRWGRRSYEAE